MDGSEGLYLSVPPHPKIINCYFDFPSGGPNLVVQDSQTRDLTFKNTFQLDQLSAMMYIMFNVLLYVEPAGH